MASEQSYSITLTNNRTEKAAIDYLLTVDSRFWVPDARSRKSILGMLGVSTGLSRAFDLVLAQEHVVGESGLSAAEVDKVILVELKTTRKHLPDLPRGFFFGATQNEFDLAEALGDRFRFCFVCLHPGSLGFCLLSLEDLAPMIRTKRTQYQINL